MVSRRAAVVAVLILLSACGITSAFSDGSLSMELGISNIFLQTRNAITEESYWGWMTAGSGAFSFKSAGDKNVKADLAFTFAAPELDLGAALGGTAGETMLPIISLDRAFVKARFPEFRLTAGKTRVGWGDGFVFNAGDIVFGSTDTSVDLTAAEIRTDTRWLTAVNVPIGRFSFIEGIVLPPEPDSAGGFTLGNVTDTSAGARFYTRLGEVKLEGGYYFDNSGETDSSSGADLHRMYLGLQGNLFADWYVSSSVALPVSGEPADTAKDTFNVSAGIFHLVSLNSVSSISFRLEGLYRPFGIFEETAPADGNDPLYGLLLYPEIGWKPADTVSLTARSIFSPIDLSAMISAGVSWNVFEGLDLSCYGIVEAGDPDDIFQWKMDSSLWNPAEDMLDGAAVIISINYIY